MIQDVLPPPIRQAQKRNFRILKAFIERLIFIGRGKLPRTTLLTNKTYVAVSKRYRLLVAGKQWLKTALQLIVVLLAIVAVAGIYQHVTRQPNPIPVALQSKLTFSPFVLPIASKDFTASDYKFATAEGNVQILSYIITTKDNVAVSVSEYNQPPQFTDIPDYKNQFLTNVAKQYDSVQTSNGTIYLGRLAKSNNRQLAVMLERGLIVFMSPDKDLSQARWHSLGDQLDIVKAND